MILVKFDPPCRNKRPELAPSGLIVQNLSTIAGDMGFNPLLPGRSPHAERELSLRAAAAEHALRACLHKRSLCTDMESSPARRNQRKPKCSNEGPT